MISNRLLFKETFKRNIWVIILSSIIFLISMMLLPMIYISRYENGIKDILLTEQNLLNIRNFIESSKVLAIPIIAISCIMGIKSFSYLHSKEQVDFYHSLPIKRSKLFLLNYIMGIVSVIYVYLIITILALIFYKSIGIGDYLNYLEVFKTFVWCTTFYIVLYSIFALATILTGNTIISICLGIFFLTIQWLFIWIKYVFFDFFHKDLFLRINYIDEKNIINSPITAIFFSSENNSSIDFGISYTKILLLYIVVAIVITILNYFLFLKRYSEKAGICIAFKSIKAPLKYLAVVTGGITIGLFVGTLTFNKIIWLVFGIILGCILLHFLAEIIYEFDFKAIFKNWWSIIACILIALTISFGAKILVQKELYYIPKIEDVAQVSINSGEFTDNVKISEDVIKLHELALDYDKQYEKYIEYFKNEQNFDITKYIQDYTITENFNIYYKLKNGKNISRYIYIVMSEDAVKILNDIIDKEKYSITSSIRHFLEIDENSIVKEIDLFNIKGKKDYIRSSNDIKQLIDILQQEILDKANNEKGEIVYELKIDSYNYSNQNDNKYYRTINLPIYSEYTSTINFIENKTTLKQENFKIEDISSIYMGNIVIKDKQAIKYILERSEPDTYQEYKVGAKMGFSFIVDFENRNSQVYLLKNDKLKEVFEYLENNNYLSK